MDGPLVDISLLSQNLFSGWLHLLKRASAKENCQKGTPPPGRGGDGGFLFASFCFFGGNGKPACSLVCFLGGDLFSGFR